MGGSGSGRPREDVDDLPIAPDRVEWLYTGLRDQLLAGDPRAQVELLLRLDQARLEGWISSAQHRDMCRSAGTRQTVSAYVGAEDRVRRLDRAREALERRRPSGRELRDTGPPPDDTAALIAGEQVKDD